MFVIAIADKLTETIQNNY